MCGQCSTREFSVLLLSVFVFGVGLGSVGCEWLWFVRWLDWLWREPLVRLGRVACDRSVGVGCFLYACCSFLQFQCSFVLLCPGLLCFGCLGLSICMQAHKL